VESRSDGIAERQGFASIVRHDRKVVADSVSPDRMPLEGSGKPEPHSDDRTREPSEQGPRSQHWSRDQREGGEIRRRSHKRRQGEAALGSRIRSGVPERKFQAPGIDGVKPRGSSNTRDIGLAARHARTKESRDRASCSSAGTGACARQLAKVTERAITAGGQRPW